MPASTSEPIQIGMDPDRFALDVLLARRDAARMLCQRSSDLIKPLVNLSQSTVRSNIPPRRNISAPPLSRFNTSLRDDTAETREELAEQKKKARRNMLPVRGDSPPCRDIVATEQLSVRERIRNRPLHAPTERQLQSAKVSAEEDSQMRQLQMKIERYAEAIADLRVNAKCEAPTIISSPPHPKSLNPPKQTKPVCKLLNMTKSKSVLSNRPVPLRLKSSNHSMPWNAHRAMRKPLNSARSSELQSSRSSSQSDAICNRNSLISVSNQSSGRSLEADKERIQSKVDALWDQTIRLLHPGRYKMNDKSVVFLKPDLHSIDPEYLDIPSDLPGSSSLRQSTSVEGYYSNNAPHPSAVCQAEVCDRDGCTSNDCWRKQAQHFLRQLDDFDAQEDSIRLRWANLSDKSGELAKDKIKNSVRFYPIELMHQQRNVPEARKDRQAKATALLEKDQELGIIFERNHVAKPPVRLLQSIPLPPPAMVFDSSQPSLLELRLSTSLHRQLLQEFASRSESLTALCKKRQILTAPNCKNVQLASVCKLIVDEFVDRILDQVVEQIDRETSDLVDDIVKGELYTQAPDTMSSINYSQTSDFELSPISTPAFGVNKISNKSKRSTTSVQTSLSTLSSPSVVCGTNSELSSMPPRSASSQLYSPSATEHDSDSTLADATKYSSVFEKSSAASNSVDVSVRTSPIDFNSLIQLNEPESSSSATLIANLTLQESHNEIRTNAGDK